MAIGDMDTCLHHERNKVVLFCSTCEELICTRCVSQGPASGSRHSGHVYLDLSEAYDIHREDMEKLIGGLRDSLDRKRQQKQQVQGRIQKLKFELLRKKNYVEKQCRSLHDKISSEKRVFNQNLDRVVSSSLDHNEALYKSLDYETVSREGIFGTLDSLQKMTPRQCIEFLRGITSVKRNIQTALETDADPEVFAEGDWVKQLNALREIDLRFHGEKKALCRAFLFAHEVPSAPRVLRSWSVAGSRSASIIWKYNKQEQVNRFRLHCSVVLTTWSAAKPRPQQLHQNIIIKPTSAKRCQAVIRGLEPATRYRISIEAVNNAGHGPPAHLNLVTHTAHAGAMTPGSLWTDAGMKANFRWPTLGSVISATVCITGAVVYTFMLVMLILTVYEKELCDRAMMELDSDNVFDFCQFPDKVKTLFCSKTVEPPPTEGSWWGWLDITGN